MPGLNDQAYRDEIVEYYHLLRATLPLMTTAERAEADALLGEAGRLLETLDASPGIGAMTDRACGVRP